MPGSAPPLALIVAGGAGLRMGADRPKQVLLLAGRPILVHTLQGFLDLSPELRACIVLHPDLLEAWGVFARQWFTEKDISRIMVTAGGENRTESVHNGLTALSKNGESLNSPVAIHDAVRPFIRQEQLERAFAQCRTSGSAVTAVPVKSSLRRRTDGGSEAVDRSLYFHVQTPQIFPLGMILDCYEKMPDGIFTDDASLAEACGISVHLCEGSYDNIKITTPEDMALAEQIMKR